MSGLPVVRTALVFSSLVATVGWAPAPPLVAQDRPVTAEPETLITLASGLLGIVSDMMVAADGRVYVADRQANAIYVVGADGEVERTIGRTGSGPGEFQWPASVTQKGDSLRVVDWRNGRLQLLSMDGEPLRTAQLPLGPFPHVFGPSGVIVSPTAGFRGDTTLAIVRASDFTEKARIGRTDGVSPNVVDMSAMLAQIRGGDVPPIMLNTAEVDSDARGSVWLTLPARATVEQFDSTGARSWSLQVQDPGFEQVRERFFTENADAEPSEMFSLRYFLNAQVVGDDLWLLLGQSETSPAVIRVVRADGSLGERMTFANVREVDRFAVDTTRRLVYFVSPDAAELLRVAY